MDRINIVPFRSINALTDLNDGSIYISLFNDDIDDILYDECAHFLSGDPDHSDSWKQACIDNYGRIPSHSNKFDKIRRRLGIPNNIAANIGNITGIQNILTDYHLLQSYRKFSQRILGTEGKWEVIGEGDVAAGDYRRKVRLYPTPKGSFPVLMLYVPKITEFRSPQAKKLAMDMMVAEAMIMVGNARSKFSGIPSPDGGTLSLNGDALVSSGQEMKKEIIEQANDLGEPMGIYLW